MRALSVAAMGSAMLAMKPTTASTACSMPRFSSMGLAPAATLRSPSCTMAWASTVAVVVPSPATSLVLVATSLASWAPMFSHGSSSSISLAMVTPSLVIVGEPHFFSSTTLRPLGPRVVLTTLASLSTPAWRPRRASSLNFSSFAAIAGIPPRGSGDDGEQVAGGEDQVLLALQLDLGAAVLRVHDLVSHLDVEGDALAFLVLTGAHGQYFAQLGLLLGGVGDHQAALADLEVFLGLDDHTVAQ